MSYLKFSEFHRRRNPYLYPFITYAPNLSNNNFNANLLDPCCVGNLSCQDRDPCVEKYDYIHYDLTPYQDPSCFLGFCTDILVSNFIDIAKFTDINLLDPWGLLIIKDIIWVANAGTGLLTNYNLLGGSMLSSVNVFGPIGNIAQPTGMVLNCNPDTFPIVNGPIIGPSNILIATRDGTINGYNCSVYPDNSIIIIDNSINNSVYTGLEIVGNVIYAVDFYNQKIDVYDGYLNKINFPFVDEYSSDPIPGDFSPYNIINIGDYLYVTYARQSPFDNQYELLGRGHGFVSIFTLDGLFVRRFVSRYVLNTPRAVLLAPSWFRYPAGSIMIGNFGDGIINIFLPDGKYLDQLKDEFGNIISIEGLRSLYVSPNFCRTIYWTASSNNLRTAYLGAINTRFIG